MKTLRFYVFAAAQAAVSCALLWFVFTMPGPWDTQRGLGAALLMAGLGGLAVAAATWESPSPSEPGLTVDGSYCVIS